MHFADLQNKKIPKHPQNAAISRKNVATTRPSEPPPGLRPPRPHQNFNTAHIVMDCAPDIGCRGDGAFPQHLATPPRARTAPTPIVIVLASSPFGVHPSGCPFPTPAFIRPSSILIFTSSLHLSFSLTELPLVSDDFFKSVTYGRFDTIFFLTLFFTRSFGSKYRKNALLTKQAVFIESKRGFLAAFAKSAKKTVFFGTPKKTFFVMTQVPLFSAMDRRPYGPLSTTTHFESRDLHRYQ